MEVSRARMGNYACRESRNADDRAHYQDGELVPYKPGAGIDPKPAAANDGTIINVGRFVPYIPLPMVSPNLFFSDLFSLLISQDTLS
jgi:hypothetical protein